MLLNIEVAKMKTEGSVHQCDFSCTLLTCTQYLFSLVTLPHSSAGNWLLLLGAL